MPYNRIIDNQSILNKSRRQGDAVGGIVACDGSSSGDGVEMLGKRVAGEICRS